MPSKFLILSISSTLGAIAFMLAILIIWRKRKKRSTTGSTDSFAADAAKPGGAVGASGTVYGKMVLTNFTYENNTPCASMSSASGKPLTPYVSVSVQFRFLKEKGGGPLKMGDHLFVKFLEGRTMPNGQKHTGWVRIDTFCGDMGDDSYCSQVYEGKTYPVLDLYIGAWGKSGQKCDGQGGMKGPGGRGQELTDVYFGPAPSGKLKSKYGGAAKGTVPCNDCVKACAAQTGMSLAACAAEIKLGQNRTPGTAVSNKCWWYTPQYNDEAKGWCTSANSVGTPASNGGQ